MAFISFVLSVETSWLKSGCESVELWRETGGWGVGVRGSGMVFMPSSLSLAALARCGVEMDLVTSFFAGMGLSDRNREGVTLPELLWTHGAAVCMNLLYISRAPLANDLQVTYANSAMLFI